MITHLNGFVESTSVNSVVMDVHGVGYSVICSAHTIDKIKLNTDSVVHLFTVLNVREDMWTLFGFSSEQERIWFNTLVSVQGVGGKVAIAILSALSDGDLYNAFLLEDKNILMRADGVGFKLANRIITELKDKIVGKKDSNVRIDSNNKNFNVVNDVVSALSNLGYQKWDILNTISSFHFENESNFNELLKKVLNKLSGGVS